MAPSLAGRTTRVGCSRTSSTTPAVNASRSVAKLGNTTVRAAYRDRKARTGRDGSHSAKHSATTIRRPARPRLRTAVRLCRLPPSRTRTS